VSAVELRATGWAAAHHFFVLGAVYLMRPLRDAMGLRGDVKSLPWVFVATLAVMALLQPGYAALVKLSRRRRFVPLLHLALAASLVAFWPALSSGSTWAARLFFVWASVANLFVVSLFWSLMADVFGPAAGARRFGLIALGGTVGAIAGSGAASLLASRHLLPATVVCVLLATAVALPLYELELHVPEVVETSTAPVVSRHRYLAAIAGWIGCYTISSTFAYLVQAKLVAGALADDAGRATLFARMDFAVNVLTLGVQALGTMTALKRLGVGGTLALLPAVTLAGFGALWAAPSLAVLVAFQVIRRSTDYGAARPARELLFTVVSRGEKYPTKGFVDTFVYRGGDALGGLLYAGASTIWLMLPLCSAWLALTVWLGRQFDRVR
jgi:AAA family ATP:ADP antiporter